MKLKYSLSKLTFLKLGYQGLYIITGPDWTRLHYWTLSKIENSALYGHFGFCSFTYICEIRSVCLIYNMVNLAY